MRGHAASMSGNKKCEYGSPTRSSRSERRLVGEVVIGFWVIQRFARAVRDFRPIDTTIGIPTTPAPNLPTRLLGSTQKPRLPNRLRTVVGLSGDLSKPAKMKARCRGAAN